ncbi:uncharacterized protein TrAtP1_004511 [Trichoderma atroviride]|uniref:uncharacterized protein n=1 Tax=Hypocrea atroviridis TaxID=63577 RepID=UPI00332C6634|nr:hypothetical protein TrAtP1_004511 [Trichoderma atroviride]
MHATWKQLVQDLEKLMPLLDAGGAEEGRQPASTASAASVQELQYKYQSPEEAGCCSTAAAPTIEVTTSSGWPAASE